MRSSGATSFSSYKAAQEKFVCQTWEMSPRTRLLLLLAGGLIGTLGFSVLFSHMNLHMDGPGGGRTLSGGFWYKKAVYLWCFGIGASLVGLFRAPRKFQFFAFGGNLVLFFALLNFGVGRKPIVWDLRDACNSQNDPGACASLAKLHKGGMWLSADPALISEFARKACSPITFEKLSSSRECKFLMCESTQQDRDDACYAMGSHCPKMMKDSCGPQFPYLALAPELRLLHEVANGNKQAVEDPSALTAVDRIGNTALHYAAYYEHFEIVEALLSKGLGVDVKSKNEQTPLMLAANSGHLNIVSLLLDRGADVNIANVLGETPLMNAAADCNEALVELLLKRGANRELKNKSGFSAQQFAAKQGKCPKVVQLLKAS